MDALEGDGVYDLSERIWHQRMAGFNFPEIANREGITSNEAVRKYRDFTTSLAADVSLSKREQIKQLELDRLDMMQRAHFMMSVAGDPRHTDAVLKIMAMRMKLLQLDLPDPSSEGGRNQVYVVSGDRNEYIKALQAGRQELPAGPDQDDGEDEEGE